MHDVYAGSFLTIQAGEARSPLEGCFMPTCHGSAETKGSERTLFTTREASSNLEAIVHIIPHTARTSALNKRGWTLQETALSHRIVQLTNYELHWRCRSDMLWETGIQYADTERLYGNVPSIHGKHSQTWSRLWRTWIENYSGREFSFPNDRLPGIAGLVKACQWRISDECCLGLWRRSLHEDLAWCRIGTTSRSPAHPLMSQPLPSWSPLACSQAVEFNRWNRCGPKKSAIQHSTKIVDCTIEWSGAPFVSELLSSRLVIRGPTRKIYLAEAIEIPDCNPPYFYVNDEVIDTENLSLPWRCAVQWDEEGYRKPSPWLCLLLQRQPPIDIELGGETFLVLEIVEDNGSGCTWRRVGIGSLGRHRISRDVVGELGWIFDVDTCQTITLV
jgi:hypothetical protein